MEILNADIWGEFEDLLPPSDILSGAGAGDLLDTSAWTSDLSWLFADDADVGDDDQLLDDGAISDLFSCLHSVSCDNPVTNTRAVLQDHSYSAPRLQSTETHQDQGEDRVNKEGKLTNTSKNSLKLQKKTQKVDLFRYICVYLGCRRY